MTSALTTLASDLISVLNQQNTASKGLSPIIGNIVGQPKVRDPNAPDYRLQTNQKCIYERRLPGNAYITAHVQRLQYGFYDTPQTHEPRVDNVRFVSVTFVFHPSRKINRFTSADISIALHTNPEEQQYEPDVDFKTPLTRGRPPRFIQHAPHLLYGSVSPETLNWNFNVAGSLGVAEGPVSASAAPSGGLRGSYKLYDMMKIQGSVRSLRSWQGREYDLEDGEMVWTLEENSLQKSGLPREFTFVMLVTKGDAENVMFDIEIKPTIGAWFGHFPAWYTQLSPYRPIHTQDMDLDEEVGQVFEPSVANEGFNFATLIRGLDDFVSLPGMTYSNTDFTPSRSNPNQSDQQNPPQPNKSSLPAAGNNAPNSDINLRVIFEGIRSGTPSRSPAPEHHPVSIPLTFNPRLHELRHSRSRSELAREAQRNSLTGTPPLSQRNPYSQPSTQNGEPRLKVLSEVQGSPPASRNSYTSRHRGSPQDNMRSRTSPSDQKQRNSQSVPQDTGSTLSKAVNDNPSRTQSNRRPDVPLVLQTDAQAGKLLFGALPIRSQSSRRSNLTQPGIERRDHVHFQETPSGEEKINRQTYLTPQDELVRNGRIESDRRPVNGIADRYPYSTGGANGDMQSHGMQLKNPVPTTRTNNRLFQQPEHSTPRKRLSPETSASDRSNRHSLVAPPDYNNLNADEDFLSEMQRPRFGPRSRPFSSYIPPAEDDEPTNMFSGGEPSSRRFSYQENTYDSQI